LQVFNLFDDRIDFQSSALLLSVIGLCHLPPLRQQKEAAFYLSNGQDATISPATIQSR
jgi:hypothetical protein